MKIYSSLSEIQRKGTQEKKEPPGDQRVNKHLLSTLILQPGGIFFGSSVSRFAQHLKQGRATCIASSTEPFSWGPTAHRCPIMPNHYNPSPP